VTAAVDHGAWVLEGSVFNGREPDANRWDFDFGPLDSLSARLWFRPTSSWEFQISSGHLRSPEALAPGNLQRTTTSASWTQAGGTDVRAVTIGYGRNDAVHASQQAVFIEDTRRAGENTLYGRIAT